MMRLLWTTVLFLLLCILPHSPLQAEEYRLGGGDVLEIKVFQEEELSRTVRVSSEGNITFPLVGKVRVIDLTTQQVADILTQLLAKDYLVNPQVSVYVREYVSRQVQVLGAVKSPGMFNLSGKATISTMLSRAGGLAEQGGKNLILVRSPESEAAAPIRIDINGLLARGERNLDLEVQGGDIIFVPKADEVYVMGEVLQPGSVTFQEGMTLLQAISKVGAFKPTASIARVQIIRRVNGKEQVIHADAKKIQDGKEKDQLLQPEDLITVPRSVF